MSTHKYINIICVAVMSFAIILTLLFLNGEKLGIKVLVDEDAETASVETLFTAKDENADWDRSDATVIKLEDTGGTVIGNGSYFLNESLYITQAGDYRISGSLKGSIIVNAPKKAKIRIALEGVNVDGGDTAALQILSADKVFLTLSEGSENIFISDSQYSDEAVAKGIDGTIYAKDDITINGVGKLLITAEYKHGIAANDNLVITGGVINVTAKKDALHVNNHFRYKNAELTIEAEDDAIHSDTDIYVAGGTITINKCYEGLEATNVEITDGDVTIYCSDDGINASGGDSNGFGNFGGFGGGAGNVPGTFGGFEGDGGNMPGNFGDFGGNGNTPSHFGDFGDFGGDGSMPGHFGDFEGYDGDGNGPDNFDGFGGFGGNGNMPGDFDGGRNMQQNREGKDRGDWNRDKQDMPNAGSNNDVTPKSVENSTSEDIKPCVTIRGGNVSIYNASGVDADGIDSNGDIYITGGSIFISLKGSGGNNALDYGSENGGVCVIDGGTVVAAGGSSMLESISSDSKQPSVTYITSTTTSNDSRLRVITDGGNVLIDTIIPYEYTAITISCEDMQLGQTITICAGEVEETVKLDTVFTNAGTSAGEFGGFGGFENVGGKFDSTPERKKEASI